MIKSILIIIMIEIINYKMLYKTYKSRVITTNQ